jgi:hypothetical protein
MSALGGPSDCTVDARSAARKACRGNRVVEEEDGLVRHEYTRKELPVVLLVVAGAFDLVSAEGNMIAIAIAIARKWGKKNIPVEEEGESLEEEEENSNDESMKKLGRQLLATIM